MLNAFLKEIQRIPGNDRQVIHATLRAHEPFQIGWLSLHATSMLRNRPRLAFHIFNWIARQQKPSDRAERWEWLKAHDSACQLSAFYGEDEERREIVRRALGVAPDNIAIYHDAAWVLCLLGDAEGALEAIREGAARGTTRLHGMVVVEEPHKGDGGVDGLATLPTICPG